MEFTLIGVIVSVCGMLMLRGSETTMLAFLVICSLFGGSAAINLPVLGNASIQPTYFALAFLIARLALAALFSPVGFRWPIRANIFLLLFVLYGFVGAFALPKVFFGAFEMPPMHLGQETVGYDLFVAPIGPSAQNITQAVYLLGTLLTGVCASMVAKREGKFEELVTVFIVAAWIHIGFGLLDEALYYAHANTAVLTFFRNGSYAQLNDDIGAFHRISGVFPEPSTYATYGCMLLVFMTELWLRDIRARWTGITSAVLTLMLLASTSSSAIVGVGAYAALLIPRTIFGHPRNVAVRKAAALLVFGGAGVVAGLVMILAAPEFAQAIGDVFQSLTTGKATSASAVQRGFWTQEALMAFVKTKGLGVGPGTFRSSSLAAAVLGSCGAAGTLFLLLHIWRIWRPFSPNSLSFKAPTQAAVGAAAGWAAVLGLIPALVAAASPDPGFQFAVFSGLSLAWGADGVARLRRAEPQKPRWRAVRGERLEQPAMKVRPPSWRQPKPNRSRS